VLMLRTEDRVLMEQLFIYWLCCIILRGRYRLSSSSSTDLQSLLPLLVGRMVSSQISRSSLTR
jgi:hypothetical protein